METNNFLLTYSILIFKAIEIFYNKSDEQFELKLRIISDYCACVKTLCDLIFNISNNNKMLLKCSSLEPGKGKGKVTRASTGKYLSRFFIFIDI